jgi:hypothetical protein
MVLTAAYSQLNLLRYKLDRMIIVNYSVELLSSQEVEPTPGIVTLGGSYTALLTISPAIVIGEGISSVISPVTHRIDRASLRHLFSTADVTYLDLKLQGRAIHEKTIDGLLEETRNRLEVVVNDPTKFLEYLGNSLIQP